MKLTYISPEIEIVEFASGVSVLAASEHKPEDPIGGNETVPIPSVDDDYNPFA